MAQKSWLDFNNKFFFSKARCWKLVSITKRCSKTRSTKWLLIDPDTSYSKQVIGLEMCFTEKEKLTVNLVYMVVLSVSLISSSKHWLRFSFLGGYTVGNEVVDFWRILIEVLKLKCRYDFVENFTILLLKNEFALGNLRART